MLEDIYRTLEFRVSLDKLASATLDEKKLADGLQAVRWYKQGKIDKIIEYCKKDVEITRKLLAEAKETKEVAKKIKEFVLSRIAKSE